MSIRHFQQRVCVSGSPGVKGLRVVMLAWLLGSLVSLPTNAALSPFQITIETGSPYFIPHQATVLSGLPIRWENPTPSPHTVTADSCIGSEECAFDSGMVGPNQSFTVPSLPPGIYSYHCRLHPIMRGTLTVVSPLPPSSET